MTSWKLEIAWKGLLNSFQICYCDNGDVVCSTRICPNVALDFANCVAAQPAEGQCCPSKYVCSGNAGQTGNFQSSLGYFGGSWTNSMLCSFTTCCYSTLYLNCRILFTFAISGSESSKVTFKTKCKNCIHYTIQWQLLNMFCNQPSKIRPVFCHNNIHNSCNKQHQ